MDGFDYTDRNCETPADSIEVAFDASTTAHLDFVNEDLIPILHQLEAGTLAGDRRAWVGYASLRFTGKSCAFLAIQQWERTCIIEIAGLKSLDGDGIFVRRIQQAATAREAHIHWGQRNDEMTATDVDRYPMIGAWREKLAELTNGGRANQFSDEFTRRVGLEPRLPWED